MTPTSRETTKRDAAVPEDVLGEPLDSLSIELGRISAEIQSINSGFQAQMEQAVAQVRESLENQYRLRLEKSVDEVRAQVRTEVELEMRRDFEVELHARISQLAGVETEIARVMAQIEGVTKEIAAMLDDPSIELSRVMRKRTEQAELKAYLDGLRFSTGEKPKAKSAGV
jgi:predicted ATPase